MAPTDGEHALHAAVERGRVEEVAALLARGLDANASNEEGVSPLMLACSASGSVEVAKCLIRAGAQVNAEDAWEMTPLHAAAEQGDVRTMALLVDHGANVHAQTTDGRSTLYLAALSGSTDAVTFLLQHGAAVDALDAIGWSAIHAAARKGNICAMALLIEHGADPLAKTEDGRSTVYLSALHGKADAVQFLLDQGVPANGADSYGWSPLHAAAESGDVRTLSLLVEHHANVHARTADGRSTLFLSALNGEYEAVRFLLQLSVAIDLRDENGWSAIHAAAESGDVRTLELLVAHGANARAETALGRSALFIAALNGNHEAVKYFLDLGLPVDATDDDGWTVLHAAADSGDVQAIDLLVAYGADIEALTTDGRSTLYVSAVIGNTDAVKYFLDHGVIVDADDDDVVESLHFAAGRGDVRTMALLAEHGADLYAQTTGGRSTLLLFAGALDGEYDTVKFLLERGAAVDAKDENGWSALLLAAQSGDVRTLDLLVEFGADVHALAPDGRSAVTISAWHRHADAVKYLLDAGVALDSADDIGWTALHAAARKGDVPIIKTLVERGADVSARATDERTPLFLSALGGHVDAVTYFVEEMQVPIDMRDDKGWTALHAAARKGRVPCMKALVEHGADAHAVTEVKSNILHIAAHHGRVSAVEYALELGVSINAIAVNDDVMGDDVMETPLTLAIQSDDHDNAYEITLALCAHGAEWRDAFVQQIIGADDEEDLDALETDWRRVRRQWRAGLCACARHWADEYLETGTAQTKIPSEVISRGEVSVSTYLADVLRSQGHELIHRCKICVVGPSEWGKTSLVRSLESNQSILTQKKDRTIGIDLVRCVFDERKGSDSGSRERQEVTFWDFAGQDVYQVAHSLFFSRRTLYVLVVDLEAYGDQLRRARTKPDAICEALMDRFLRSNIFRWVRRILAHQPDARFAVVGTKADRLIDPAIIQDVWRDLEDRLKTWLATSKSGSDSASSSDRALAIGDDVLRSFQRGTSGTAEISSEEQEPTPDFRSGGWLVVNPKQSETIAATREALQHAITVHELGFPMWKTYAKVQRAVSARRDAARQADGTARIERSIIRFKTLRNQLVDEFEALGADECEQILRTLNDLGEVLWYEHEGAGVLKDFIILDPMLVIDVVREVIRHDFSSTSRAGEWPRDGRIAHELLCSFPMWRNMDMELMHAFKALLQHFQLAYPADDDVMHPDSDLIVPTYWQVARSASSRSLLSRQSVCDAFSANLWCWEYDLSSELAETIFEQFAVQSHSAHMKRSIRGACIEATCDEFASSITLVQQTAAYDTIRIQVGGATVESSWHTMRFYLMKMEKVLERYNGAVVGRYIVYRPSESNGEEQRKPVQRLVRALEDAISLGKDDQSVRAMMPWMPPDLLWYLQRAWNNIASFQQLQMTRYIQEKLEVVRKLAIAGSAPRFPALWSLEHTPHENKVVLRVSSDLSGRCFHVPMEIDTGSPVLAKYGSILKSGLSIFSTVAADALSFPVVQTVIEAATSGIEGSIDHAQRVHNLIERLNLPIANTSDRAVFDSKANPLAPGVAAKVLRDLLSVYNDSSDELEISEITNLECAVTASGEYVWAHAHEIAMLGNGITRCAAPPSTWALLEEEEASQPESPMSVASTGGTPRSPAQKRASSSSSSKLKLRLSVEGIDGLADWDWYKVYCKWQLLYGETMSAPIAGGATAQHADAAAPPAWGNVSTTIKSVASWEMLRECRLAVQVKRRSRIGWTKLIGEGSVSLGDVIDDEDEQMAALGAVCVPLDGSAKRVVRIRLALEAP